MSVFKILLASAFTTVIASLPAFAIAQVTSRNQCEATIDRMIKSSGMGESRLKLGLRVTANSFSRADLESTASSSL